MYSYVEILLTRFHLLLLLLFTTKQVIRLPPQQGDS